MRQEYQDLPLFMKVRQYADATGMNVGSVRRAIAKGLIPAEKCGGEYRICRSVVFPNTEQTLIGETEP